MGIRPGTRERIAYGRKGRNLIRRLPHVHPVVCDVPEGSIYLVVVPGSQSAAVVHVSEVAEPLINLKMLAAVGGAGSHRAHHTTFPGVTWKLDATTRHSVPRDRQARDEHVA